MLKKFFSKKPKQSEPTTTKNEPTTTKNEDEAGFEITKFYELNPSFFSNNPTFDINVMDKKINNSVKLKSLYKLKPTDFIEYNNQIHCKDKYDKKKIESLFKNEDIEQVAIEQVAKDLISIKYTYSQFNEMKGKLKIYLLMCNVNSYIDRKIRSAVNNIAEGNLDDINNITSYNNFLIKYDGKIYYNQSENDDFIEKIESIFGNEDIEQVAKDLISIKYNGYTQFDNIMKGKLKKYLLICNVNSDKDRKIRSALNNIAEGSIDDINNITSYNNFLKLGNVSGGSRKRTRRTRRTRRSKKTKKRSYSKH